MPKPIGIGDVDLWGIGEKAVEMAAERTLTWQIADILQPHVRRACVRLGIPAPRFMELVSKIREYLIAHRVQVAEAIARRESEERATEGDGVASLLRMLDYPSGPLRFRL